MVLQLFEVLSEEQERLKLDEAFKNYCSYHTKFCKDDDCGKHVFLEELLKTRQSAIKNKEPLMYLTTGTLIEAEMLGKVSQLAMLMSSFSQKVIRENFIKDIDDLYAKNYNKIDA